MTTDCGQVWNEISDIIRKRISADGFERWFEGVQLLSDDGRALVLRVPNPIHQFFIESNYLPLVQEAAMEILSTPRKIQITTGQGEAPAARASAPAPAPEPAPQQPRIAAVERPAAPAASPAGMNSRNTFDTFVVGSNNQFAHSASLAVAKAPSRTYNPLFIYGGSGLGKTHLLQAIGHQVISSQKSAKVVYLSSEQF